MIDLKGETDAAFGWQTVFAMGSSPAFEYLVFAINLYLKTDLID